MIDTLPYNPTQYFITRYNPNPYFHGYQNIHIFDDFVDPRTQFPKELFAQTFTTYVKNHNISCDDFTTLKEQALSFYDSEMPTNSFYGKHNYKELYRDKRGASTGLMKVQKVKFEKTVDVLKSHFNWVPEKPISAKDLVLCFLEHYLKKIVPLEQCNSDFLEDNQFRWTARSYYDNEYVCLEFKVRPDYLIYFNRELTLSNKAGGLWEAYCYPGTGVCDFLKQYFSLPLMFHSLGKKFSYSFDFAESSKSVYPHLNNTGAQDLNTFMLVIESAPHGFEKYTNHNFGYL